MRKIVVSIVAVSMLFACHALADASEGIVRAPVASPLFKDGRNTPTRPRAPERSAQTRRTDSGAAPVADSAVRAQTQPAQPTPTQQDPGPVCCCRFFAQGWQHAWRGQSACDSAGGSCVAPDHCRQ
ncbi:MAG: hypothetical protein JNK05_21265 [Myxococcales bacterium]|nr:hypothetical protein [Myxococcales bacterium]